MLTPTSGTITVLGEPPASSTAHMARVGFVAQDTPTYAALSIADHLRMGAELNPAGTTSSPNAASGSSAWTPPSAPDGSPADNAPNSH